MTLLKKMTQIDDQILGTDGYQVPTKFRFIPIHGSNEEPKTKAQDLNLIPESRSPA